MWCCNVLSLLLVSLSMISTAIVVGLDSFGKGKTSDETKNWLSATGR